MLGSLIIVLTLSLYYFIIKLNLKIGRELN